jgi:uncharacterized protein
VDMARHRFGSGEYRYFTHDLPTVVAALRAALYPRLLPIALDRARRLGRPAPWPDSLQEWLKACHTAGQDRSARILPRPGEGDRNALHRDVSTPCSSRFRSSSASTSTAPTLVFTTRDRPVRTKRGRSAGAMRHGVSTVRSGHRHALGP